MGVGETAYDGNSIGPDLRPPPNEDVRVYGEERPYETTFMATGLTYALMVVVYFFLGFVLTFRGYLMAKDHRPLVGFIVSLIYFIVLFGYMDHEHPLPDNEILNNESIPHLWVYIYSLSASLLVVLCLALCEMVAIYLAGTILGAIVAEGILLYGFPDTQGYTFSLIWCLVYAGSIPICAFLMKKIFWHGYCGSLVISCAGGLLLAWAVNFVSILIRDRFWIEMMIYEFLEGLTRETFLDYAEKEDMKTYFIIWSCSTVLGFAWQIQDVQRHQYDDDGNNFIASDYEQVKTGEKEKIETTNNRLIRDWSDPYLLKKKNEENNN